MTAETVREKALALPPAERASLIQDLWDSLEMDDGSFPLSAEHAKLIDERLAEHSADPAAVVPWPEAREQVRRAVAEAKKRK